MRSQTLYQLTLMLLVLGTLGFSNSATPLFLPAIVHDSPLGCLHAAAQRPGSTRLAFPAEEFCRITDPDQDGQLFSIQEGDEAQGWRYLKAPDEASAAVPAALKESLLVYKVRFATAGIYQLHLRVRSFSTGQDSIFIPLAFGAGPDQTMHLDNSGFFVWQLAPLTFEVTNAELGRDLELQIGTREHLTELDSLAFVKATTDSSPARLDAEMGYFEAENAKLNGVESFPDPNASGQSRTTGFWQVGNSLDFGYIPVAGRLYIQYSLQGEMGRQASVYVNNVDVATVQFATTGAWDSQATTVVYLPRKGLVRLQIDADDFVANQKSPSASIDRVAIGRHGREIYLANIAMLQQALAVAGPGDTFILADGDYIDAGLRIDVSGTPLRPITLRAQTVGGVTFQGRSALIMGGNYLLVDGITFQDPAPVAAAMNHTSLIAIGPTAHHNRLTNLSIININGSTKFNLNPEGKGIIYRWLYIRGAHNQVDHSTFINKVDHGPVVYLEHQDKPTYNVIDHNRFERSRSTGANGEETIAIVRKGSDPNLPIRTSVKYNLFFKCNAETECISNKSNENYYLYNTLLESRGWLVLRDGNRAWIEGNIFIGGIGGIRVHGSNHIIVNNHFQDLTNGIFVAGGQAGLAADSTCYDSVDGLIIAHNTFAEVGSAILVRETACGEQPSVLPSKVILANNLVSGGYFTLKQEMVGKMELAEFNNVTTLSDVPVGWYVSTVPNTLDETGIWRPLFTNLLVDTAETALNIRAKLRAYFPDFPTYPLIDTDLDGQVRGMRPDIGADEITATPGLIR